MDPFGDVPPMQAIIEELGNPRAPTRVIKYDPSYLLCPSIDAYRSPTFPEYYDNSHFFLCEWPPLSLLAQRRDVTSHSLYHLSYFACRGI